MCNYIYYLLYTHLFLQYIAKFYWKRYSLKYLLGCWPFLATLQLFVQLFSQLFLHIVRTIYNKRQNSINPVFTPMFKPIKNIELNKFCLSTYIVRTLRILHTYNIVKNFVCTYAVWESWTWSNFGRAIVIKKSLDQFCGYWRSNFLILWKTCKIK